MISVLVQKWVWDSMVNTGLNVSNYIVVVYVIHDCIRFCCYIWLFSPVAGFDAIFIVWEHKHECLDRAGSQATWLQPKAWHTVTGQCHWFHV